MEDLSQHILDISFNSLEAGATELRVNIEEDTNANLLEFEVKDNGRGIAPEEIPLLKDPFYTTKGFKPAGLGIPLLHEAAKRCGGGLEIAPRTQKGVRVRASFSRDHVDRAPLGDIAGTLVALVTGNRFLRLIYHHRFNGRAFSFDTREIKMMMRGVSLQTPEVLMWLESYLCEQIAKLRRLEDEKFGRAG